MKRLLLVLAAVSTFFAWTVSAHNKSVRPLTPELKLIPTEDRMPQSGAHLDLHPYAVGTLVYRGQELTWYAVVERTSHTVGVTIVTHGRQNFRYNTGDDMPIDLEFIYDHDVILNYLVIYVPVCDVESLENISCDYVSFIKDVVLKLQRVPEFSCVCVSVYVGGENGDQIPCSP